MSKASAEFIKSAKDYAKVEYEDDQFEPILNAAIERAEVQTGKKFTEESYLYKQAVKMLASDWYDKRGTTTTENVRELPTPISAQSIFDMIAIAEDYASVDASTN